MSNIVLQKKELTQSFDFIGSIKDMSDAFMKRMLITFKNGFQLSVITGQGAYVSESAPYEIAPFDCEGNMDGDLFDEDDKGDDVCGYCTPEKVLHYIKKIGRMSTVNNGLHTGYCG